MEPKFKNCGRVFRLWNKHQFANTYLGLGILQSLNYDLNVLFENVELWEKRNKLFHYSPLSLLRAFLGDKSQQNQNVLQSLASFEQKRRNLERFSYSFNSNMNTYTFILRNDISFIYIYIYTIIKIHYY